MVYLCIRKRRNGALDEWLSQRSAKPSTAVRIRQAPHKKSNCNAVAFLCYNGLVKVSKAG